MHLPRPTSPRVPPIEKVAARAREVMADSPANAVNVVSTLATAREMNKAFGGFANKLLFHGTVDPKLREIAILRMGWNCQAIYEFGQHTLFGYSVGMTPTQVYDVTRPISLGTWSAPEAAVIQLVDDMWADDCVSDATWAEMEKHFSHSDIIEFMMAAGTYRTVSCLLNSCGVQLDEGVPGWPTKP